MVNDGLNVQVKGLKELTRACNDIQRRFPEAMQGAADQVATKVVAGARGAARTPQQRLAASTLNTMGSGTLGSTWGGFAGSEFGGGARPNTRQFPPHQGKRGYFLYPSMRRNASSLNAIWDDAIDEAMKPWNYRPIGT